MHKVQINPIPCLGVMSLDFKSEKILEGYKTIQKHSSCELKNRFFIINVQQQHQQ